MCAHSNGQLAVEGSPRDDLRDAVRCSLARSLSPLHHFLSSDLAFFLSAPRRIFIRIKNFKIINK